MKKKIAFKFLSAIISLTLLIGVCAPAINVFASTETDEKTETTPWFSQETLDALNSYGFNVEDYVNKENLDQIKSEYSDEIADLGVAIENIVRISKTLGGIIAENYDLVYAGAYAELKANGTLDEIVAELQATNAQLNALADKLDSAEVESIYADAKANLVKELRLSAQTVDQITALLGYETLQPEMQNDLLQLCDKLVQHGYVLLNLADALNQIGKDYTDKLVADLIYVAETTIANIKAETDAKIAELEAKLAELEAELESAANAAVEAAKAAIEAEIESVKAKAEAQIAAVNAQLNAQIEAIRAELNMTVAEVEMVVEVAKGFINTSAAIIKNLDQYIVDFFKANLGDVYSSFASTIVESVKSYILSGKVENLDEATEAIKAIILEAVKDAGDDVYAVIESFVDEAVKVTYTLGDDSYLVSLNGGSAYYAELLAAFLMLGENQVGFTNWDNIDYDMLALADLVTIGYDEDELTGFAVSQLIGYLVNYVDVELRGSTEEFLKGIFAELKKNDINLDAYDNFDLTALDMLNDAIDEILANELVAGKEMQEMDWEAIVGAENLHYVDEAREALKAELLANGIEETFSIEFNLLDFVYENVDSLGNNEVSMLFKVVGRDFFDKMLGDSVIYTIEIPVADSLVFAAESFLYNYVNFNVSYGKLIIELNKINPEASVVLLGYYNAFNGISLDLGDVSVNVGEAYQILSDITSVQPFLLALYYPNVAYVDITNAETVFESYVKAGVAENDLLSFLMLYLTDSGVTEISPEGQEYVFDQILNALVINCNHEYDNACDIDCNRCGMIRDVADHVYSNPCDSSCDNCGKTRPVSGHVYSDCTDKICNLCGASRPAGAHAFDGCTDTTCNKCNYVRPAGEHVFDGCDDERCNNCYYVRLPESHVYDNCGDTDCNKCGAIRGAGEHTYSGCDDADCDVCGATREAGEHTYSGCDDTDCNNCGATRVAGEHEYDGCSDTVCNKCNAARPSVKHQYTNACDADCDVCGATREPADHVYTDCVDTACDVCGAKRAAGKHTLDDCTDTTCEVCGATVAETGHTYGDWTVEVEATKDAEGKKVRVCKNCGHKEEAVIPVVEGSNIGLTFAIVIGAIIVADIVAFAIYWFLIQKKTFADILPKKSADATESNEETK